MDAPPLTVIRAAPAEVTLTFWSIVMTTVKDVPLRPVAPSAGLVETTLGAASTGSSTSVPPPQATNANATGTDTMVFQK